MIGKVLEFEIRNPANMWVEPFVPIKFRIYFLVVKHWSFLKEALKCTWVWRHSVENPYKEHHCGHVLVISATKCSYDFCSGQGQGGGRAEGPRWFPESFGDSEIWRNNFYHPTCQEGVCFKHCFVQQQLFFFFRTMHFLYSKFLSNATRTSARRKSRGSRKKWASWLLEHVKGGKFSVETTAKIGTNTSPLKLDCCLFSAWGVIHMIGTKFGGSWLCGWFLLDPQKHQSYAPQHLLFSCPATVQHMGLSKWLGGEMSSSYNLNITEGIVFSAKAVEPALGRIQCDCHLLDLN